MTHRPTLFCLAPDPSDLLPDRLDYLSRRANYFSDFLSCRIGDPAQVP